MSLRNKTNPDFPKIRYNEKGELLLFFTREDEDKPEFNKGI